LLASNNVAGDGLLNALLGTATVAVVVFAVVMMIRHRFEMRRLGREEAQGTDDVIADTAPEFAALELHYGKPLPDDVRWLYEQRELIASRNLELRSSIDPEDTYSIDQFLPATVKSVTSTWFDVGRDRFPFAVDDAGNYFVVKLGDRRDSEVLYVDHEQSTTWPVASSLRDFVTGRLPA
jgi:SMI1-KNR4 cell-wall